MPNVAWPQVISYGPALLGEEWYRGLMRVTGPVAEPITLAEAKAHLRVEHNLDDGIIGTYLSAARSAVESHCSRALCTQTWKLILDRFPYAEQKLRLYRPPLAAITQIRYLDIDQAWKILDPAFYRVIQDNDAAWLKPADITTWWPYPTQPQEGSVEVTYTCGYFTPTAPDGGDPDKKLPFELRAAMLLILGDLYTQREDSLVAATMITIPRGAETLMSNYRAAVNV